MLYVKDIRTKNVSKLMQDNDTANLFLQNEQPFKFMDKFFQSKTLLIVAIIKIL